MVFINCMEKLTMNAPKGKTRCACACAPRWTRHRRHHARRRPASGPVALIEDHPRFRDVQLGIIVSSLRALQLFILKKSARTGRMPDYVVVEGLLAGGHLGFGMDWAQYDLATIVAEIRDWMRESLDIPLIPAGGIFTGTDAANFLEAGAAAVQVATRFTITRNAACPTRSSRNTSRPAKTTSRSTRSRRPAIRCAC